MTRTGACAGLRVLDLTQLLPGAVTTLILADLGADVLKVERPGEGDYMRWVPPVAGEMGAMFAAANRNKRSMTLDLKTPAGQDVLRRLAADADVLIEGFRPGVADRLGAGFNELSALNPRLVYCSLSGYGQTGPYARRPGHDLNYLAAAGITALTGAAGEAPALVGPQIADVWGGGITAAVAVLVGLLERGSTGRGRFLDVSMLDGSTLGLVNHLSAWLGAGVAYEPGGLPLNGGHANYGIYRAKDGYVTIADYEEKFWRRTCAVIGRPGLVDSHQTREAEETLREVFATKTRAEWEELLGAEDSCFMPVLTPEEAADSDHFAARGLTIQVGAGRQLATPVTRFGDGAHTPAPALGAHTDEVLTGLGLDPAVLRAEGAV
ncbi:CoA transferase [Actinomadura sp. KC345]|uniref:CaiB/BaiF CoA transferase family protein n=1 Tax=Actinomadura sp. KC345 TaxID=2530371 RepID=UPI00105262BA|nr:CoA transferase [Actinomadura sp. KC345]TDC58558.1 CoA transferase [Actinomadura sp. KC345]